MDEPTSSAPPVDAAATVHTMEFASSWDDVDTDYFVEVLPVHLVQMLLACNYRVSVLHIAFLVFGSLPFCCSALCREDGRQLYDGNIALHVAAGYSFTSTFFCHTSLLRCEATACASCPA